MKCNSLQEDLRYLFDCNFFDEDFDPEGNETHQDFAGNVLAKYNWEDVYNWFFCHLTTDCISAEAVYNALNLYYCYCFDEYPIRNPYELIGYILARIDLDAHWDEYGDFIDGFANSILQKTGNIDLQKDPYYQCWKDPHVQQSVEEWRKKINR